MILCSPVQQQCLFNDIRNLLFAWVIIAVKVSATILGREIGPPFHILVAKNQCVSFKAGAATKRHTQSL